MILGVIVSVLTRGNPEGSGKQSLLYPQVQEGWGKWERRNTEHQERDSGERTRGAGSTKQVRSQGEHGDSRQVLLLEFRVECTREGWLEGDFLGAFEHFRS